MDIQLNLKSFEIHQKEHKLKEAQCAEKMGISSSQLWKVKKGIHSPGTDFIIGALKVFPEVSFEELFFLPDVLRSRNNCVGKDEKQTG